MDFHLKSLMVQHPLSIIIISWFIDWDTKHITLEQSFLKSIQWALGMHLLQFNAFYFLSAYTYVVGYVTFISIFVL